MGLNNYTYKFDLNNCPYKDVCKLINSNECNSGCVRYMEMDFLLYSSGIPLKKRTPIVLKPENIDLDKFVTLNNIKNDIVNFVNSGYNLYLYSLNPGNGKTSWAIKILLKYFDEIWCGNGLRPRALFINVPNFLRMVTENVQNPTKDFLELKQLIADVDLVVWDDLGATKLSDFDHKNLLSFIDQRLLACKSNIYTGNLPFVSLQDAIGQRLASRVYNESYIVELKGSDRRGWGK